MWRAYLASQFAERRCRCGAPAVCVLPGQEAVRSDMGILIKRETKDRAFCLKHAPGLRGVRAS